MASSKKFGSAAQEPTANVKEMEGERQPRYRPVNVNLFLNLLYNNWELKCTRQEWVVLGLMSLGCDCLSALFHSLRQARRYFLRKKVEIKSGIISTTQTQPLSSEGIKAYCPLAMTDRCSKLWAAQQREGLYTARSVKFLFAGNLCAQNTEPFTSLGVYFSLRRIICFCESFSFSIQVPDYATSLIHLLLYTRKDQNY